MANKFNVEQIFAQKTGSHAVAVSVRPQNIVRFYEKAIKAMKSQSAASEKDGTDPMAILEGEMQERYSDAQITYYIALHYVQDLNQAKQAIVIL